MRIFLVVILSMFFLPDLVYGQNSKRTKVSPDPEADAIITNTYTGIIPLKKQRCPARLILKHCRYCDEGTFAITANPRVTLTCTSFGFSGEWTVLRGSAIDENATVVELDGKGTTFYYLRHKNGDMQQLDSLLREIKPIKNYMLLKQ